MDSVDTLTISSPSARIASISFRCLLVRLRGVYSERVEAVELRSLTSFLLSLPMVELSSTNTTCASWRVTALVKIRVGLGVFDLVNITVWRCGQLPKIRRTSGISLL